MDAIDTRDVLNTALVVTILVLGAFSVPSTNTALKTRDKKVRRWNWHDIFISGLTVVLCVSVTFNVAQPDYHTRTTAISVPGPADVDPCLYRMTVLHGLDDKWTRKHDDHPLKPVCSTHYLAAALLCHAQRPAEWFSMFPAATTAAATTSPPPFNNSAPLTMEVLVHTYFSGAENPDFSLYQVFNASSWWTIPRAHRGVRAKVKELVPKDACPATPTATQSFLNVVEVAATMLSYYSERELYEEWVVPALEDLTLHHEGSGWWSVCDGMNWL